MIVTPLDSASLPAYAARVRAVAGDAQRQWGRMRAAEMLAHLAHCVALPLGDVSVPDQSNWLTRSALVKWFFYGPIAWPKGARSAPIFFPAQSGELEAERGRVLAAMERFVAAAERAPEQLAPSPFCGPLTLAYYRRIHGKHLDHHLRQFGV